MKPKPEGRNLKLDSISSPKVCLKTHILWFWPFR